MTTDRLVAIRARHDLLVRSKTPDTWTQAQEDRDFLLKLVDSLLKPSHTSVVNQETQDTGP